MWAQTVSPSAQSQAHCRACSVTLTSTVQGISLSASSTWAQSSPWSWSTASTRCSLKARSPSATAAVAATAVSPSWSKQNGSSCCGTTVHCMGSLLGVQVGVNGLGMANMRQVPLALGGQSVFLQATVGLVGDGHGYQAIGQGRLEVAFTEGFPV